MDFQHPAVAGGCDDHKAIKIYQCRIQFRNTKGWGFTFYDLSGDDYSCSTVLNGWHYIDYNSSEPTIIAVD
jgi:hypothetical protein